MLTRRADDQCAGSTLQSTAEQFIQFRNAPRYRTVIELRMVLTQARRAIHQRRLVIS